ALLASCFEGLHPGPGGDEDHPVTGAGSGEVLDRAHALADPDAAGQRAHAVQVGGTAAPVGAVGQGPDQAAGDDRRAVGTARGPGPGEAGVPTVGHAQRHGAGGARHVQVDGAALPRALGGLRAEDVAAAGADLAAEPGVADAAGPGPADQEAGRHAAHGGLAGLEHQAAPGQQDRAAGAAGEILHAALGPVPGGGGAVDPQARSQADRGVAVVEPAGVVVRVAGGDEQLAAAAGGGAAGGPDGTLAGGRHLPGPEPAGARRGRGDHVALVLAAVAEQPGV